MVKVLVYKISKRKQIGGVLKLNVNKIFHIIMHYTAQTYNLEYTIYKTFTDKSRHAIDNICHKE